MFLLNDYEIICQDCNGVGLVNDPSELSLSRLYKALNELDERRDWIVSLIEKRRQEALEQREAA